MTNDAPRRLPPIAAAMVGLPAVIAVAAMVATRLGAPSGAFWDVAWTAAATSALAGMFVARRGAPDDTRGRWTLWMLAAASWLVGQLLWNVYGIIGFPASPNLADVGWWSCAVLVIVSVVRSRASSRSVRVVVLAEALPVAAAAIALSFGELWRAATLSTLSPSATLSALAYPTVYLLATVLMLQSMVAGSLRGARSPALRSVLVGMGAQAAAFVLWSEQLLRGTYVPGATVLDPLWTVGLITIGVGGLLAARRPERTDDSNEPARYGGVLPSLMFLLLIGAFVRAQLVHAATGDVLTLGTGLVCAGAALIIRGRLLERRLRILLHRERGVAGALAEREAELARLNAQLVEDSRHDPLTGMRNRRALTDDLHKLEALRRTRGVRVGFVICDIDHFKAYNDELGHIAGDAALSRIATVVQAALDPGDIAYRFGGEELLLILRDVGRNEALAVAERVRLAVERAGLAHPAQPGKPLTLSVGVATGGEEADVLLERADGALYEAKDAGRNRVVLAAETQPAEMRERRRATDGEAVPRHLRGMLAVSRAAAADGEGGGVIPALQALAEMIRTELGFQVVAVNLLDDARRDLTCVVVLGEEEARQTLLGMVSPWAEWERILESEHQRGGAVWLPAGSDPWVLETPGWSSDAAGLASADAWHPDDMLLLPLRARDGRSLGIVSVDQPAGGRRPDDDQISLLMTVADHAGLALEQSLSQAAHAAAAHEQSVELRLAAVMLLAETLDLRDPGTARHSRTVGTYARQTAEELGLEADHVRLIHAAGVVHDLGKLGIADSILFKPGSLDDAEWREIQRHPEVGERILAHAGLPRIAAWVRAHHERIDGHGYPDRLAGDDIPLEARILAVADAYEAMTADRPYRTGMPAAEARAELERCAGAQFDPAVVRAFMAVVGDRKPRPGEPVGAAA